MNCPSSTRGLPRIESPTRNGAQLEEGTQRASDGHSSWGRVHGLTRRMGGCRTAILYKSRQNCVRTSAQGGSAGLDRPADVGTPRESGCATVNVKRAVGLRTGGTIVQLRRASVTVSLALLLSAATADAQGKYLLWSYFTLRDGEYWQANYAFDSK